MANEIRYDLIKDGNVIAWAERAVDIAIRLDVSVLTVRKNEKLNREVKGYTIKRTTYEKEMIYFENADEWNRVCAEIKERHADKLAGINIVKQS